MDYPNVTLFSFSTLNDVQLFTELSECTTERLPFSVYENLRFEYSNRADSNNLLSELDPDLHTANGVDTASSKYFHVEALNQTLSNSTPIKLFYSKIFVV